MENIMWNPWHGCIKYSEGCKNCYVYLQDTVRGLSGEDIYKVKNNFTLPIDKNRLGEYKIPSGEQIATCFTSDFFLKEADKWRQEAWDIMRQRPDLLFFIITKRVERIAECLPDDFDKWDNVFINVTCENQKRADERLPIFLELNQIHKKGIVVAPILEEVHLDKYLKNNDFLAVSVGGESCKNARPCNYTWVKIIRNECISNHVSFSFHQTGSVFIQGKNTYYMKPKEERTFAKELNINIFFSK